MLYRISVITGPGYRVTQLDIRSQTEASVNATALSLVRPHRSVKVWDGARLVYAAGQGTGQVNESGAHRA